MYIPCCPSYSFAALTPILVDANIAFPSGLTVTWAGKPIGNIKIDDVKVFADVGAVIDIESQFEVADVAHLTEFTKVVFTA